MALTKDAMETVSFQQAAVPSWSELRRHFATPQILRRSLAVHLIRHGETETNARRLVTGAQDVALTERGREQARDVGRKLAATYDAAFCSALSRSRETLEIALRSGDATVSHVFSDARLNERSLGELELKPATPIPAFSEGDLTFAPRGGDSYLEVARRALSFLLDLSRWADETSSERVLISGHMGPMRMLVAIVREETDPVHVLARSFNNAELLDLTLRRVTLPPFVSGAV